MTNIINVILKRLNAALEADRKTVSAVFQNRIDVPRDTPLLSAECPVVVGADFKLGALGIINGLHGSPTEDIMMVINPDGEISYFIATRTKGKEQQS